MFSGRLTTERQQNISEPFYDLANGFVVIPDTLQVKRKPIAREEINTGFENRQRQVMHPF